MRGFTLALVLVLIPATTFAAPMVDNVFIIDTSASMGGDINQVRARIGDFNTALVNEGIDAHYGLVRFAGNAGNVLIEDITDFANFTRLGGPFQTLVANQGNPEDGSRAIEVALTASFRPGSFANLILITDEDDDIPQNRPNAINALNNFESELFLNIIGNPNDDSNQFYQNSSAQFGGAFFNILSFRTNPDPFIENFIETKIGEIQAAIPEPASIAVWGAVLALSGLGYRSRRKAA